MKYLVVTGVVGLAVFSAYFLYKADRPETINPAATLPAVSQTDLKEKFSQTQPMREVEKDVARIALERIGLWEESEDIYWDDRTGDNGNYLFTNLVAVHDGEEMRAEAFEITGLRLLDEDVPIYDGLTINYLTMVDEDSDQEPDKLSHSSPKGSKFSLDVLTVKLPESATLLGEKSEAPEFPLEYVVQLMEPGKLSDLPELYLENAKFSEKKRIRDYSALTATDVRKRARVEGQDMASALEQLSKPVYKSVEDVTTLGFAALSKNQGTGTYSLQAGNFSSKQHNYTAKARTTSVMSIALNDFESDAFERFKNLDMNLRGIDGFDPFFGSLNIQGIKSDTKTDVFDIDNISVWHSDTQGDRFTRKIDVPRFLITNKPIPESNSKQYNSNNPFRELGYESITLSFSAQNSYDRQSQTVTADHIRLAASDAFNVNLSYKGSNMSFGPMFTGRLNQEKQTIEFGKFDFTDRGIMDRAFAKMAEERNMTIEEAKESSKSAMALPGMMAKTDYQKELVNSANEALKALIDTGGRVSFSLRPQRPIDLEEFSNALKEQQAASIFGTKPGENFSAQEWEQAQNSEAMDTLLREMNISFEHFIAD